MMSSDSVLDAIVSAAEAMTMSVSTPPRSGAGSAVGPRSPSRQGGFTPEAKTMSVSTPPCSGAGSTVGPRSPSRQGGFTPEGTVSSTSFSVIDINCSDKNLCFGVIGRGSAFCIRKNCNVGMLVKKSLLLLSVVRSPARSFPNPVCLLPKFLRW